MTDAAGRVIKRSLVIAGHATSVSLEEPFWRALRDLAARESLTVTALVARIDGTRGPANLSSAIRVHLLEEALARALSSPDAPPATLPRPPARREAAG